MNRKGDEFGKRHGVERMVNASVVDEAAYRTAPEPGQLVEVRRRQWIVSDVQSSRSSEATLTTQNYVSLSSIEEDSLGETLEVILGDRARYPHH